MLSMFEKKNYKENKNKKKREPLKQYWSMWIFFSFYISAKLVYSPEKVSAFRAQGTKEFKESMHDVTVQLLKNLVRK